MGISLILLLLQLNFLREALFSLIFKLFHFLPGVYGPQVIYFLNLLDRIHLYVFEDNELVSIADVSLLLHEFLVDIHDFSTQFSQR